MPLPFGFATSGPVAAALPTWASPPPAQWRTPLHDAFGHQPQSPHVPSFSHRQPAKPSPSPPPPAALNRRRRRRSETPASDDSFDAMDVAKRPRREIKGLRGPAKSMIDLREKAGADVDLGKMLGEPYEIASPTALLIAVVGHQPLCQSQPSCRF